MPEDQFRAISRFLVPVDLPLGMQLATPAAPIEYVYFPVSGLISVDALTASGESVEVSVIGREGMSGVYGMLGHTQGAHSVVMQGPGSGFRIRMPLVRDEFLKGGPFAQLIYSFLYMQMVQMSQSVLCNRLHPVESRMARWLLTQEFLAQMLGSRRSTVTVSAGNLQREGLIDYTRGRVRVVDRPRLEAKACECYHIVRSTYDTLIGRDY
jgi:CRP-like cAMP-binding protein